MRHCFILKTIFIVKFYKELDIKVDATAAQSIFIDIQKTLTKNLKHENTHSFKE
jgi:hypothetical protein